MIRTLTVIAVLLAMASPASATWHGKRPQREASLLKAITIRSELRGEIRAAKRAAKRREARIEARKAARAARMAQEAPGTTQAAPVTTYTGGWADALRAVGFPESAIGTMLYYIDRESGGDPSAVNPTSGACGLTQIYPYQPGCLDPMTNLRMAYAKFKAGGFSPWGG